MAPTLIIEEGRQRIRRSGACCDHLTRMAKGFADLMSHPLPALAWLSEAVSYQIYPATFAESDGDGIGDLAGNNGHLDYLSCGDEVGICSLPGLPDKEGGQFDSRQRRSSRTPMQWDAGPSAGFPTAAADRRHLPIHPDPDRPWAANAQADKTSMVHKVHKLIKVRKLTLALGCGAPVRVLHNDCPSPYTSYGTATWSPSTAGKTRPVPGSLNSTPPLRSRSTAPS